MKTLALVAGIGAIYFFQSVVILPTPEKPSNPWKAEEHVPNADGYMHPFPCHGGESARPYIEKEGCYVWNDPRAAEWKR